MYSVFYLIFNSEALLVYFQPIPCYQNKGRLPWFSATKYPSTRMGCPWAIDTYLSLVENKRLQNNKPKILQNSPRTKPAWSPDFFYGCFHEGMQSILWWWIVVIWLGTLDKDCRAYFYEGIKCWGLSLGNSSNTYNKLAAGTTVESVFWPPFSHLFFEFKPLSLFWDYPLIGRLIVWSWMTGNSQRKVLAPGVF